MGHPIDFPGGRQHQPPMVQTPITGFSSDPSNAAAYGRHTRAAMGYEVRATPAKPFTAGPYRPLRMRLASGDKPRGPVPEYTVKASEATGYWALAAAERASGQRAMAPKGCMRNRIPREWPLWPVTR